MASYIATVRFTEQGIAAIQETCKRAAAFKAAAKKMGVKVSAIYWTHGAFDGLIVFDAPDDTAATAAMLQLASQGNVRTETARAFQAAEMEKVLTMLPG
jgi:uncharacterized protein with GYD domain